PWTSVVLPVGWRHLTMHGPVARAAKTLAQGGPLALSAGRMADVSKTLRAIAELREAGLVPTARAAGLEPVAARYAVAITPEMVRLIDPNDPRDPIARQFVPDARELEPQPDELSDPIGDDRFSPVPGV